MKTETTQGVTLDHWRSFDDYDAIVLATHGKRLCDASVGDGLLCRTVLSTGIRVSAFDFGTSGLFGGLLLTAAFDPDQSTLDYRVGADLDFFRIHYPNGLDHTLLILDSCETGSVEGDELAAAAGGDSFVMMAWTESVYVYDATRASNLMIEQLSLGLTSQLAYQAVIEAGLASADNGEGRITALEHIAPDDDEVRLVELPTLIRDGQPMRDGAELSSSVTGTPGDDRADTLALDLRLIGIDDPSRYSVRYEIDGRPTGETYGLASAIPGDLPYSYSVRHEIEIGFGLPLGETELSAIVLLPEGGESRYSVHVALHGTGAVITVGSQTWEFELVEYLISGCLVGANGVVTAGTVDGDFEGVTFSAELRPDGGRLDVMDHPAGLGWMANDDRENMTVFHLVPPGDSQIDEITFDGNRIWGTATFIETTAFFQAWHSQTAFPGPVSGTFEIRCPG